MKTPDFTSVVARFIGLAIVTSMGQLVGCASTDINPVATSTAKNNLTNPSPKPKEVCLDCIDTTPIHINRSPVSPK
ncbi:MAG: hypothetical protein H7319_22295 [Spirosoma sp.]|nr:hypothetical protein [Spirosoma sp.]